MRILLYNPDNGVTRNFMPHIKVVLQNHHAILKLLRVVGEMGMLTSDPKREVIFSSSRSRLCQEKLDVFWPFFRIVVHHRTCFLCIRTLEKANHDTCCSGQETHEIQSKEFLLSINGGRKIAVFPKKQTIFIQDDRPAPVFYIQRAGRLTVVSKTGRKPQSAF